MAEPAFYICQGCNRSWERMEPKWGAAPPRVCPHCGAGREKQATNEARERAYVRDVYGPVADAIAKAGRKC